MVSLKFSLFFLDVKLHKLTDPQKETCEFSLTIIFLNSGSGKLYIVYTGQYWTIATSKVIMQGKLIAVAYTLRAH